MPQDEVHCELVVSPTRAALEVLVQLAVLTVHHCLCVAALSANSAYITELPLGFKCLECFGMFWDYLMFISEFKAERTVACVCLCMLVSHFGHARGSSV